MSDEQRDIWKNKFMLSDNERSMAKALPPQDNMGRCLYIEKEVGYSHSRFFIFKKLEMCEFIRKIDNSYFAFDFDSF